MASRRKQYRRTEPQHSRAEGDEKNENSCFMADLLAGRVKATALHVVRDGRGRLIRLDYDDPNG